MASIVLNGSKPRQIRMDLAGFLWFLQLLRWAGFCGSGVDPRADPHGDRLG